MNKIIVTALLAFGFTTSNAQEATKEKSPFTFLGYLETYHVYDIKYKPTTKIQLGIRGEYYNDEKGVIITSGTPNGFKTFGYSANFDYLIIDIEMFRIEARNLKSNDTIFF